MPLYRIEWQYADGHGVDYANGEDEEQAIARFWKRFGRFLPMAYEHAVAIEVPYDGDDE